MEDKENEQHSSLNDENTRGLPVNAQVPPSLLPAILHRLGLSTEQARDEQSFDDAKASLKSDDWEARIAAVRALGKLDTAASVALIASALDDQDGSVRAAAVHVLGNVEKQSTTYWLVAALHDADWHVRETAVLALGKQGQRVPREVFMTALHDTDGSVREAARLALQWHSVEERPSASYGRLWEKKPMQREKNETISLNGQENSTSFETVPYDARDGMLVESRYVERAHNMSDQVQIYAPQEYASYEYGDTMPSRGEKITPSSHWPKKAWLAVLATAILFFLLGGGVTFFLLPFQIDTKQVFPQPMPGRISIDNINYDIIVEKEIASALHLDPQQITAQLKAGKSMTEIAAAQGVSSSDLHNIELKAFANSLDEAVKAGDMDQSQADVKSREFQNNPQLLDNMTTKLFLSWPFPPPPVPNATAVPSGPGGN